MIEDFLVLWYPDPDYFLKEEFQIGWQEETIYFSTRDDMDGFAVYLAMSV